MKLYEILNVEMNATSLEIEKSYKKMILDVHPNRNNSDINRFHEINEAYQILKDSYKRDFYNIFGEKSLKLLNNGKEGFIISRMFSKYNIITVVLLLIVIFSNLLFLPVYVYLYKGSDNACYSIYIVPLFVACWFFLLPIHNAYRLIHKLIFQLFKMLYVSINVIVIGTEALVVCLFIDRFVDALIAGLITTALEILIICFNYYGLRKIDEFIGNANSPNTNGYSFSNGFTDKMKAFIPQVIWSLSILTIFIPNIPSYVKIIVPFISIISCILMNNTVILMKIILCIPVILYSVTFCLVVFNVKSLFIFTPLLILFLMFAASLIMLYLNLPSFKKTHKAIVHLELV